MVLIFTHKESKKKSLHIDKGMGFLRLGKMSVKIILSLVSEMNKQEPEIFFHLAWNLR